ncbi:hypothetical protein C8R47DRAFT_1223729 [Mycena vitilis]|nr:hypothetical protein C8R47DRAFT_1223729 [Mycena vitilis]
MLEAPPTQSRINAPLPLFTTTPLETALQNRGRTPPQYCLAHPPNVLPDFDTATMIRIGTEAETGYHTPFRLLTKKIDLLEEHDEAAEDASMPPVSPRSPEPEMAASSTSQAVLSSRPTICSPIPQGWAASNVRLEKLQANAQRCAMATLPSSDANGVSKFVFSVHQSLVAAAREQRVTEEDTSSRKSDLEHEQIHAYCLGRIRTGGSVWTRVPTFFPLPHQFLRLRLPGCADKRQSHNHLDGSPRPSFTHIVTPVSCDCRSTRWSPSTRPLFIDGSDTDSLPSLRTLPSEEESSSDPSAAVVANPQAQSNPVDPEELERQLERIARPPSTPNNRNWPLLTDWSNHHAAFVNRVRTIQNNDAIAFIRQANTLLAPCPDILDLVGMQTGAQVDVDVEHQVTISDEDCTRFAECVQSLRDTLNAYSPGLVDAGRAIRDIHSVPVSLDGRRHRFFSCRALDQSLMYRESLRDTTPIGFSFTPYCGTRFVIDTWKTFFQQRGWIVDAVLLHQDAPVPPPYLQPHEYSRLRLFKYTFALHGQFDVVCALDDFLRYRFRDPEIVSHFLHAGLLDPNDIRLEGGHGRTRITHRTVPSSPRARAESKKYRVTARKLAERERAARQ